MFLSHNIVFNGKNGAKVMYFMKLAILIFGCPGDMHITNCTRMPQVCLALLWKQILLNNQSIFIMCLSDWHYKIILL